MDWAEFVNCVFSLECLLLNDTSKFFFNPLLCYSQFPSASRGLDHGGMPLAGGALVPHMLTICRQIPSRRSCRQPKDHRYNQPNTLTCANLGAKAQLCCIKKNVVKRERLQDGVIKHGWHPGIPQVKKSKPDKALFWQQWLIQYLAGRKKNSYSQNCSSVFFAV